ncbi:MAG: peptide ABC transporter substrate-binding protein [Fimbriimonadaceae bacterium]|nr:peptide ABC transporter substrate-binding protein [Fimbriimonadaceae bacterium]
MVRAALLFSALALVLAGCGSGGFSDKVKSARERSGTNVFRYPIVTSPTTMDPHLVQDGDTIDLLQQVYEGLVGWGPENVPVGLVAESWQVSEDGKVYTFTLRQGAKFHNGREVTAEDVKWSFDRCTNPKLASPVADAYFGDIVGVNERVAGKADSVSGIKVIDPTHVEISLKQPTPYFLGKLTYIAGSVLPKGDVPPESAMTEVGQMVGTGPFKVAEIKPQQLVVLDANADYHGGAPKIARMERPVILDAVTRLNKFKAGEVDLVQLERQDIASLQQDPTYKEQLNFFQRPAIWYVAMNRLQYPPFADRRVRQAFAMAINKGFIVEELLGGVNTIANSIVPPGVPGGDRKDAKVLPYDPAKAKALLAEAGYPGGKGLPPLNIFYREDRPDIKIVAEAVVSQLKANLGVEAKQQAREWGAYLTEYNAKRLPFCHMRWAADYLDPQNFLSHMLATYGPENKMGMNSPAFDALCRQADSTMDMNQRLPLYAQAEDIALQEAVWVPIYFQRDAELISPRVSGLRESLFGHLPHTTVEVSQ